MNSFISPLRYPGGKKKLAAFIAKICIDNNINGHYVEPYAGGASVALFLLFEGYVETITINDKDKSIYAFWYSVLYKTNELCKLIEETDITINNWKLQKVIQKNKDNESLLNLGFSTLFLNRTNRSGIINGGVMGGKLQNGDYKIDCRFNKVEIIDRIRKISKRRDSIRLYNIDAIELIDIIEREAIHENIIFYFDPPYYLKGSSLYMNYYKNNHHLAVSRRIKSIVNIRWIVSYDDQEEIKNLYIECDQKEFCFKHTAHHSKKGEEILFFSPNLFQPLIQDYNPIGFKFLKKGEAKSIIYKHPQIIDCALSSVK